MLKFIKEATIKLYLLIFKLFYILFNFMLQKQKTIFVTSFANNSLFVMDTLKKQVPTEEIVILKDVNSLLKNNSVDDVKIYTFNNFKKPIEFIQSIYHLATSRIIFIDNYFEFISGIPVNKKQIIIQLGHAVGAIKTFGLEDTQVKSSKKSVRERIQFNYDQIDFTVVGSERMGELFMEAFNTTNEHLIRTGVPRTDFFFDELEMKKVKNQLEDTYSFLKNKKVILYAPTYHETKSPHLTIDYKKLKQSINDDYVIMIKHHPKSNTTFVADVLPEFVYDVSSHENVNELLTVVDILITDYSSLPFEFALLNRPMIFYVPDLESYKHSPGLWEPLANNFPGPITKDTDELIWAINHITINQKALNDFNVRWNTYSIGNSTRNLIDVFYP